MKNCSNRSYENYSREKKNHLVFKHYTIRYMVNLSTTSCGLRHVPAILTQEPTNRRCVGPRTSLHAVKTEIPAPSEK